MLWLPPPQDKLWLNLGDPRRSANPFCNPAWCRTFLADSFVFCHASHRLCGEWCLSGLRRKRQNINWWRRAWSIRHWVQWRFQTAGKKGWKFWLLKSASSRDAPKELGHLKCLGAGPEPLGGHRSYQDLVKALIKQCTRQTQKVKKAERKLPWATFTARYHLISIAWIQG